MDKIDILNQREEMVLRMIVDEYIRTSEPVGSRFISKFGPLSLSPASIRNVMSDLEDKSLIEQTHTSSGRIPSDLGLRYYIDKLISVEQLDEECLRQISSISPVNVRKFFDDVSRKLGELTHSIGFVLSPKINSTFLKHIEFVRLNKTTALTIIVTKTGIVHNILLDIDESMTEGDLVKTANYINENFVNKNLLDVKNNVISEIRDSKDKIDETINKLKSLSAQVFLKLEDESEIIIHGTNFIVEMPEYKKDTIKLKECLKVFDEKKFIYDIVDKCISDNGVKIFVGSEISQEKINELGIVVTPYTRGGHIIGSLGVIGPKRMAYTQVLPIVDYTARVISNVMTNFGGSDDE